LHKDISHVRLVSCKTQELSSTDEATTETVWGWGTTLYHHQDPDGSTLQVPSPRVGIISTLLHWPVRLQGNTRWTCSSDRITHFCISSLH